MIRTTSTRISWIALHRRGGAGRGSDGGCAASRRRSRRRAGRAAARAGESSSSSSTESSTSPVGSCGLRVASLRRHELAAHADDALEPQPVRDRVGRPARARGRSRAARRPMRSRRSMKISPPWSRRRPTQPDSVSVRPASSSARLAAAACRDSVTVLRHVVRSQRRPTRPASAHLARRRCATTPRAPTRSAPQTRRPRAPPSRSPWRSCPLRLRPARSVSAASPRARPRRAARAGCGRAAGVVDRRDRTSRRRRAGGVEPALLEREHHPLDAAAEADARACACRRSARRGRRSARRPRSCRLRAALGDRATPRPSARSSRGRAPAPASTT